MSHVSISKGRFSQLLGPGNAFLGNPLGLNGRSCSGRPTKLSFGGGQPSPDVVGVNAYVATPHVGILVWAHRAVNFGGTKPNVSRPNRSIFDYAREPAWRFGATYISGLGEGGGYRVSSTRRTGVFYLNIRHAGGLIRSQ